MPRRRTGALGGLTVGEQATGEGALQVYGVEVDTGEGQVLVPVAVVGIPVDGRREPALRADG
ncbi:MAG: hypothetical protein SYR96_08060 [Actinomycetota bacterium]|nr:hypothetical protein [Actinomycetota bacterium]